jgi:hypothetical protein
LLGIVIARDIQLNLPSQATSLSVRGQSSAHEADGRAGDDPVGV